MNGFQNGHFSGCTRLIWNFECRTGLMFRYWFFSSADRPPFESLLPIIASDWPKSRSKLIWIYIEIYSYLFWIMLGQNLEKNIDAGVHLHEIWNFLMTENHDEDKIIREQRQFMPDIVLLRKGGQNEVWPWKWTTAYDLKSLNISKHQFDHLNCIKLKNFISADQINCTIVFSKFDLHIIHEYNNFM